MLVTVGSWRRDAVESEEAEVESEEAEVEQGIFFFALLQTFLILKTTTKQGV